MTRMPPVRPLIIATRGDVEMAPENTLPAFESAIARGADGVELHDRGYRVHGSNLDSAAQIRQGLERGIDQFSTGRLGLALRMRKELAAGGDGSVE